MSKNVRQTKHDITPQYREELAEAFAMFDKDNSGSISSSELATILKNLNQNYSDEDITKMVRQVDADGNGEIDFDEFVGLMLNAKSSPEDELKQAFNVFDANKSGKIDKNELRQVLKQLGWSGDEDLLSEMMKLADVNGDGEIDYEEFVKMMKESL